MSQQQIIDYLKEHHGWHDTNTLMFNLNLTASSIYTSLRKIIHAGEVKVRLGYYWNPKNNKNQPINEYKIGR